MLDPAFVTEVAAILAAAAVRADLLTLELTEGVVVADPRWRPSAWASCARSASRLSVDDFGTGYSSLTYLKGLPVDEVKIDKGFVDGLAHDPADRAVVRAVVDIAHTLGLRVVAEGVEHEEQQRVLRVARRGRGAGVPARAAALAGLATSSAWLARGRRRQARDLVDSTARRCCGRCSTCPSGGSPLRRDLASSCRRAADVAHRPSHRSSA